MAPRLGRLVRTVGFAAVAACGIALLLHTPPARRQVLAWIAREARVRAGLLVEAGRLDYNLAAGTVRVADVRLRRAGTPPAGSPVPVPFLEAGAVEIHLDGRALVGGPIVAAVRLVRPRVTLVRGPDGDWNLPRRPPQPPAEPERIALPFGRLQAVAGAVAYRDETNGVDIELEDVSLAVDARREGEWEGRLEAHGAAAYRARSGRVTLERVTADFRYDGRAVALAPLAVEIPEGSGQATGHVEVAGRRPGVDVWWRATLDVGRVAARWTAVGPVDGVVTVGGHLAGPLASPTLLLDLGGGLAGGRVTAAARVAVDPAGGPSLGAVHYSGLDLARVLAAARILPPVRLAASLDGVVAVGWDAGRSETLRVAVETQARDPSARRPSGAGRSARALGVDGRAFWALEQGRWTLRQRHTLGGALTVSGRLDGRLGRERLADSPIAGRVEAETGNLARLLGALEAAGVATTALRAAALEGPLRAEVELGGTLGDWRADGRIHSPGLETRTTGPANVDGRLLLDTHGVSVRGLEVRDGPNRLDGAATVSFDHGTVAGAVTGTIEDPGRWLRAVPAPWRPAGRVTLRARVAGRLARPVLDVDLAGEGIEVAGQALGRVEAGGGLSDGTLVIERFSAEQSGGGRLSARGRYEIVTERYHLEARLTDLALRPLPRGEEGVPIPLEGRATGTLDMAGTRGATTGQGALAVEDLVVGPLSVGRAAVEVVATGRRARVRAHAPALASRADVTLELAPPYRFALVGAATDTDLARWWPHTADVEPPLAGRATLAVDAAGALERPAGIEAEVSLDALALEVGPGRLTLGRPARLRYAAGALAVDGLRMEAGATRLDAAGRWIPGSVDGRLTVSLDGRLEDLEPFLSLVTTRPVRATGRVRADIAASGAPDRPVFDGELAVDGGALGAGEWPPLEEMTLRAVLRDGVVNLVRLEAGWSGARLTAGGRVPLLLVGPSWPEAVRRAFASDDRTARLSAHLDPITTGVLAPFLPAAALDHVDLRAAARVTLEADAFSLDRVRGEAVLDRLALTLATVDLEQRRPTRLALEGGRLAVRDWAWTSPAGDLSVSGGLDLGPPPRVDARLRGRVALRALGVLVSGVATGGVAEADLLVTGAPGAPDLAGTVDVSDAEIRVATPRLVVTGARGRIELAGDRLSIRGLVGDLNGGRLELEGDLRREGWRVRGGEVAARVAGAGFEWPRGLRTEVSADLALRPAGEAPVLLGRITVERGVYRQPLVLTEHVLAAVRGSAPAPSTGSTWLDRLRLDVTLATADEILVDNNYGRVALSGDLHLSGTAARPGVTGRLALAEGGRLYLGGHVYRVERGTVELVDPGGIEPVLDFSAHTRVSAYDVTLSVRGSPGALAVELASDPPLAQGDLVALLVTGHPLSDLGTRETVQAQEQVLSYLSGDLLGLAGARLGVDVVRIERGPSDDLFGADPALVAAEVDPRARLSLTKRLGDRVEVVLSHNLETAGRLTWIALYRPRADIEVRALSLEDATRGVQIAQRLAFGAPRAGAAGPARARGRPRIAAIQLALPPDVPDREARSQLRVAVGEPFDVDAWLRGRDRLEAWLHTRGYLEARVRTSRTFAEGGGVTLAYQVEPGPVTTVVVRGDPLPVALRREIEERWILAVVDEQLAADVRDLVRRELARAGYVEARADVEVVASPPGGRPALKTLVVEVERGVRVRRRAVVFTGNEHVAADRLEGVLRGRGLDVAPWVEPAAVDAALRELYVSEGFLDARIATGKPQTYAGRSLVPVTIVEGPRYALADVRVLGARGLSEAEVRRRLGFQPGQPFRTADLDAARRALEASYRRAGYPRADVRVEAEVDATRAAVAVTVQIDEGPRQVVREVTVAGATDRLEALAARALGVSPDTPATVDAWVEARRRLYETGAFRRVDLRFERLEPAAPGPGVDEPVRAVVTVEPHAAYRLRYGLRLADEFAADGAGREVTLGVTADLERRVLFGRAVTAGVAGRYERDRAFARVFARLPRAGPWPGSTSAYLTRAREHVRPARGVPFVTDRTAVTARQDARLPRAMRLTWGYTFERSHIFDPEADPRDPFAIDYRVSVGRVSGAWARDTRDDPFDPTRGAFAASNVEYASSAIGSDLRFVKVVFQTTGFRQAGPAVLAGQIRLGTGWGFGQALDRSERFFAGGASSVRGYAENALGPVDVFTGEPEGGESLFVMNGEVRVPVAGRVRAVAFVDAGNAFARPADLSLRALELGVGAGVRLDTPLGLVRVDFGVPVTRRAGQPFGRWYVSLGHAF